LIARSFLEAVSERNMRSGGSVDMVEYRASVAVESPAAAKPQVRSAVRVGMLALLALGTMINYLDRSVISVAAPGLSKDLGLSAATMGFVFSAFSWSYAAAQIPGGIFIDRFGSKLTYFLSITFWSIFTLLQGFAAGLSSLIVLRLGLGLAEAPCFPTNSRIVSTWFPQQERAKATAVYTVGEYVALAFFSPLLFLIMAQYGWRVLFFVIGAAGVLFGGVWWLFYREPGESKSVTRAELDYIAAGGGVADGVIAKTSFSWSDFRKLLSYRQIWGVSIGQFLGNSTLIFFLTWFPTYLATERHMGWVKVGFFAILPFMAAGVGVLFGGWLSDRLLATTGSANIARKLPVILGLLLASTIVASNYVDSNSTVVAILSLAFFGQGMVGLSWAIVADIAPKRLMGLTGGFYSFVTNLSGIVTPIVIGLIVAATGSFVWALVFICGCALLGIVFYAFVLGDIRRIDLDAPA
jgi:ACS family D-galactonate transporter-like MFS transporter